MRSLGGQGCPAPGLTPVPTRPPTAPTLRHRPSTAPFPPAAAAHGGPCPGWDQLLPGCPMAPRRSGTGPVTMGLSPGRPPSPGSCAAGVPGGEAEPAFWFPAVPLLTHGHDQDRVTWAECAAAFASPGVCFAHSVSSFVL